MIESHLHTHLIEHLNSEIVLETITDVPSVLVRAHAAKTRNVRYGPRFLTGEHMRGEGRLH